MSNFTNQNEFYAVAFRKKVYGKIEQLQEDVDKWMNEYNEVRTHSGKYCFGRSPLDTFREPKHLALEKMLNNTQPTIDEVVG